MQVEKKRISYAVSKEVNYNQRPCAKCIGSTKIVILTVYIYIAIQTYRHAVNDRIRQGNAGTL